MEKLLRHPRTAWRQYEEQVLVITPDDRRVHTLNETGTFLWNTVGEAGADFKGLKARFLESFSVDSETLQQDLDEFVKELVEKNILVWGTRHRA